MSHVAAYAAPSGRAPRARWLHAAGRLRGAPRLNVLIFHRVLDKADPLLPFEPTAAQFEARMRWVAANFKVLTFGEAVDALKRDRLPKDCLCVTFDDGYADNHDLAMPILRGLQLRATFFVASGYLNGGCMFNDVVIEAVRSAAMPALHLDDLGLGTHSIASLEQKRAAIGAILGQLKYVEPQRRQDLARQLSARAGVAVPTHLMMTSSQVVAMHQAGLEIGAHTVMHPILARVGIDVARNEIATGRDQLQQIINAPVRVFAYPNGKPVSDYQREHTELVRGMGFDGAVSTAWGTAAHGADLFQIPRFTPWDRSDLRFELRMIGNLWRRSYETA